MSRPPSVSQPNGYSPLWFSTFLGSIDVDVVEREVAYLERQLPQREFGRVLDLCCGVGRHSAALVARGHSVIGVDRNDRALQQSRRSFERARLELVTADMRALPICPSSVDGVICMWQSFGQFDSASNRAVLAGCAAALRPGGRLVLDLYHREYHEAHLDRRRIERREVVVDESRRMVGNRLSVSLVYRSPADQFELGVDHFEWQLYTPPDIQDEAQSVGLELVSCCADFNESIPASAERPRMQLVFSRSGAYL